MRLNLNGARALLYVALLLLSGAAHSLNMNESAYKGFARAYGFVYAQQLSLEHIARAYPELKRDAELAQLAFQLTFPRAVDRLGSAVSAVGDPAALNQRLATQLDGQIQGLTYEQSVDFIKLVNSRAAGNVSSPELEFILAAVFEDAPVREFSNRFRQSFKAAGHAKAKGLRVDLQLPKSWLAEEANRPNIVKKWTSANGTGLETVLLLVKTLGGERVTKADVAEYIKSGDIKDMVPDEGRLISAKAITIEAQPGFVVEFDSISERAGSTLALRSEMYAVIFGDYFVSVQCIASAGAGDAKSAATSYARVKPLCQQVANSLVFPGRY